MPKDPLDLFDVEHLLGSVAEPHQNQPVTRVLDDGAGDRTMVGQVVCGYRLLGHLGSGGHSEVYYGRHSYLDTPCAIKVLKREFASSENVRRRFLREAQVITRLDHPNVVKLLSYGEANGRLCIVLEYLAGRSLRQLLQSRSPMPEALVRELGTRIASGLAAIHELGLVHRDVKPGNIMVLESASIERVKLLDLGVVRFLDPEDMTRLTDAGFVLGTPAFMSPEQRNGSELGPASDCYSLGLVLFNMVTGSRYSGADTDLAATGALRPIITRLLALDPNERPSAAEVTAFLKPRAARRSGSLRLQLAMFAFAIVVSASALLLMNRSTAPVFVLEHPIDVQRAPEVLVTPRREEEPPHTHKTPAKKTEKKPRVVESTKRAPPEDEERRIARALAERGLRLEDVRHLEGSSDRALEIERLEIDERMLNARLDRILMKLRRLGRESDPVLLQALEARYLQLRKSVAGDRAPRAERMLEAEELEKRIDRSLNPP